MRRFLVVIIAGLTAACGNLPSGGREVVRFRSDPDGALATTSLGPSCVTPCQIEISRLDEFTVTFSKAGYASRTVGVSSSVPSLSGGVTLAPGVRVGFINQSSMQDPTGSFRREHQPNPVVVTLEPAGVTGTGQ